LDWKWLFIYEQGIALVNELAAPLTIIQFKITSSSVMNSFHPALAGRSTMPGMETKLHAVINKRARLTGFRQLQRPWLSNMRFKFHGYTESSTNGCRPTRKSSKQLTRADYLELEKPSERDRCSASPRWTPACTAPS
jgi:cytochrome o ubiquinol oxidase subunit 2